MSALRITRGQHRTPDVVVHRLNRRIKIAFHIGKMNGGGGDGFSRLDDAQGMRGDRTDLERHTASLLELHAVINRPGKLSEKILATRLVLQNEIGIVIGKAPGFSDHVRPSLEGGPAVPAVPLIVPPQRVAKPYGRICIPESARPRSEPGERQWLSGSVGDFKPSG